MVTKLSCARVCLLVVMAVLSISLLGDLAGLTVGGLTADVYYLPLRKVQLEEESRKEIESIIIDAHGRLLAHQRRMWLALHGIAFVAASVACFAVWQMPDGDQEEKQKGKAQGDKSN